MPVVLSYLSKANYNRAEMGRKKQSPVLEQRVARFIREHSLVSRGSCLLVAVSGGADSTCLLHLLSSLKDELGIKLHVAHLDHQLRGAESEADAAYVAALAHRLGVPATIEQRDVRGYQKEHHLSLEEAAREVRYRFLADTADSVGADRIATGHTRDDQVETILMHLVRGTGTRGLIGLKPNSQWRLDDRRITIIRPLLEVSRQETADYCHSHRLEPRLDASNLSLSPLRNRIRRQLLPLLRSYNPGVAEVLLRTAATAADELAFLNEEVAGLWSKVVSQQGKVVVLDKNSFSSLSPALKRHLLRKAIEELLGNLKDIEVRHIEEIMAVLDKPAGKQVSLPWGLVFAVEYGRYLLGREPVDVCPFPPLSGEYTLNIPGETRLPGWRVEATIVKPFLTKGKFEGANAPSKQKNPLPLGKGKGMKGIGLEENNFVACLDLDQAGNRLTVRRRKPGDRFQPLGLGQPKKLNEFMIDARIPCAWRGRIPVVYISGQALDTTRQIVWLVGYRIDERVKVTAAAKRVLRLEFKPE
jgi:tRNA(Ile)-lysidine synthase